MSIVAGMSGGARSGCVALAERGKLVGACAQERVTRVRSGRRADLGAPVEALDLMLQRMGRRREDVGRYIVAESCGDVPVARPVERIDHHFAHACTAYLTSPFTSAAIVVCDHHTAALTVWVGQGPAITPVDWPWVGPGFAAVFSGFARALGFGSEAGDRQMEALGRLRPDSRDAQLDGMLTLRADGIEVDPGLERWVADRLAGDHDPGSVRRADLAAALQGRLGELLLSFLQEVQRRTGAEHLCLGGGFFYHSSMNTLVKGAGLFSHVFIPMDPGNAGLAVGATLHALGRGPASVSPFLGPSYSPQETKEVLDNCKLQYSWESEEGAVAAAVRALREGRLVAWFDGGMEWGPRALGARSILANPQAPYVLENLNHFLKRRKPWRGYALSGLEEAVAGYFDGPAIAPFMECDYRPRDRDLFKHALPSPEAAVRVHTVASDGPPRFRRLLEAMGEATGLPFVINTSFNGFHEPIVCSPRDAVRVFYGSGLDLLVMNQFLLRK